MAISEDQCSRPFRTGANTRQDLVRRPRHFRSVSNRMIPAGGAVSQIWDCTFLKIMQWSRFARSHGVDASPAGGNGVQHNAVPDGKDSPRAGRVAPAVVRACAPADRCPARSGFRVGERPAVRRFSATTHGHHPAAAGRNQGDLPTVRSCPYRRCRNRLPGGADSRAMLRLGRSGDLGSRRRGTADTRYRPPSPCHTAGAADAHAVPSLPR